MPGIPQKIRDRAEMIRLNGYGWSVAKIVKYMKKSSHTVRASLHRWQQQGIKGLWKPLDEAEKESG
jgi:transposase